MVITRNRMISGVLASIKELQLEMERACANISEIKENAKIDAQVWQSAVKELEVMLLEEENEQGK